MQTPFKSYRLLGSVYIVCVIDILIGLLYGFVPINDVAIQAMADGRSNYEITTQITVVDWLYHAILSPATITSRTVIVTR